MSILLDEPRTLTRGLQHSVSTFRAARVSKTDGGIFGVEGWLVTYGAVNENGWLWVPGAAQESLKTSPSQARPLPMGYQHSYGESLTVIGRWTEALDSVEGVHGSGRISDTTSGRDAATLLADEAINGISVGFEPEIYQFVEPGERVQFDTPYGTFAYDIQEYAIVLIKAELVEASIVADPADDAARVDRLIQSTFAKANRALPALKDGADWADTAYSMALVMGGRGAAAFVELPELQHRALYDRIARSYIVHGKTPPAYEREPVYSDVQFRHDERAIFTDRYLRKSLDAVIAGAAGIEGALSLDTREQAKAAADALSGLLQRRTDAEVLDEIAETLRGTLTSVKGI